MCAKITRISPLAPSRFPALPAIEGVRFSAAAAGVRYKDRSDVMLAVLAPGTAIAGTFTRSATRSAPVLDCQAKLAGDQHAAAGAAILVNSGNANAFTGRAGDDSVAAICAKVAETVSVPAERVFTASTGVIGERLPHDRIEAVLGTLRDTLSSDAAEDAARAIMTTDTFAKGATATVETAAGPIRISGFSKGSGMIAPDMATMLSFVFTDARLPAPLLQDMVARATASSFNCITVDSDTSTSDTLLVAATGKSAAPDIVAGQEVADRFYTALHSVLLDLAQQVVRDGEGATKFVEVRVTGARDNADARRAALAVGNSPLVKTAIAGEDPNWGRVVMAVGKSGATADRDRLSIAFGELIVAENGWVSPSYSEDAAAEYMKRPEIALRIDLGVGDGQATIWTCDLTHDYIAINADYRS